MPDDPFEVLGVTEAATPADVRAAYLALAKTHHPDAGGDPAAFAGVRAAVDTLSDPHLRAAAIARRRASGTPAPTRDLSGFDAFFRDTDLNGRGNIPRGPRPRRGVDTHAEVSLTLAQARAGGTYLAEGHPAPCQHCEGGGTVPVPGGARCEPCGGRGRVRSGSGILTVDVVCPCCAGTGTVHVLPCGACAGTGQSGTAGTPFTVPAGVDDGALVTVPGMGGHGSDGGRSGDLAITVHVLRDARFTRRGRDLALRVRVPVWTAALGGVVTYADPDGNVARLVVPPGTHGGTRFAVTGGGMPSPEGPGTLYVTLDVAVPDASAGGMREAFERVRALAGGDARQVVGKQPGDGGSGR